MTNIILPRLGDKITFTRVPVGSYASVGVEYLVTYARQGQVQIKKPDTGAGTIDDVKMYRLAKWTTN